MLGHLQHQARGAVLHLQRVEDWWEFSIKLYVHHSTNNGYNAARCHASLGGGFSFGGILAL